MIDIEDRHKKIILDILKKHPYNFYAFGSRVKGKAKRFSNLEEQFEKSNLPYTVDIVDWNSCEPSFQEIIKNDLKS